MLKRYLFYFFLFFSLISSTYSVAYYDPTPEDGSKMSGETIQFVLFDEEVGVSNCEIEIDGIFYNMTYSGNFCTYNLTPQTTLITEHTFQGHYNSRAGTLSERSFTYYPPISKVEDVNYFGLGSYLLIILLLLVRFSFNRK